LSDLQALAAADGRPLDEIVAALRDAGLEAVAEVPLDLCHDAAAAIETARGAGLRVERVTVHALAPESRVPLVERARDLQALVGGIQVFAPLQRTLSAVAPTTGYDDVKQVAIARLVAANIPSIQVDWPLYGPKLAQVALTVGADDVDGVAAFDPATLGARRSALEEIRRNIRAAALEPVERDGRFAVVTR
jgi:aminodeoxyfutalosine synthase